MRVGAGRQRDGAMSELVFHKSKWDASGRGWQGMGRFFLHPSNLDEARPMPCAEHCRVCSAQ